MTNPRLENHSGLQRSLLAPNSSSGGSVLSRLQSSSFSQNSSESPLQSQVDGLVTHFVDEATQVQGLASLAAGSLAYRYTRFGVMALGEGRLAAAFLRPLSVGIGLGGEVVAFEGTSRSLATLGGDPSNPNLWRWDGRGGWGQGLFSSFVTFGMLKGAGHLSRESNLIFQHSFSSSAMVAGHQTAALFGWMPRAEGSLAEQLLHAEATNLQLGAGTALMHSFAPGVHSLERGLDLSLRSRESRIPHSDFLTRRWDLQPAGASEGAGLFRPSRAEKNPWIVEMSSTDDPDKKDPPPSLPDTIPGGAVPFRPARDDGKTEMDLPPESLEPSVAEPPSREPLDFSSEESRESAEAAPNLPPPAPPPVVDKSLAETRHDPLAEVERIPPTETGLKPGQILTDSNGKDRYQVLDYLGSGGFGHVVKVKDLALGRFAVIKVPRPERNTKGARARFANENQITAKLDPRRVIPVYDIIALPDGRTVPVMEYVPGHDLSEVMHQISIERQLEVFTKICEGVESAHRHPIVPVVHRDLKPANIRITEDGDVRIMDWGLAKAFTDLNKERRPEAMADLLRNLNQDLTVAGSPFGSPGYIAPEMFRRQYEGNPQTIDVFALGVILYEMMAERHPFTHGKSTAEERFYSTHPTSFEMPPQFVELMPEEFPSSLYDRVQEVAWRAMDPDPKRRFQSVSELRQAVHMIKARVDYDKIIRLRDERKTLEEEMSKTWSEYRTDQQITPQLEEEMEGSITNAIEKKGEIEQEIESLILYLTGLTNKDPAPEARKMIAELSWLRLVDGGDLMPKRRQQDLMDKIRDYDIATERENQTSMRDALGGQLKLEITARNLLDGQLIGDQIHLKVIPIEEHRARYFREASPLLEGPLRHIRDQLKLPRGYYVMEVSAPGFAFMRIPLHITLDQVRKGLLGRDRKEPLDLNLEMIPQKSVPRDFFVVHAGEAVLGHDIYRFDDPSFVISLPERKTKFKTFAVTNLITIDQYKVFIEEQIKQINFLIPDGLFEEAVRRVEELRDLLPRYQPRVSPRDLKNNPNWESLLDEAFDGVRFHWRVKNEGKGRMRRFSLVDPTTHPTMSGDPIQGSQPVSTISYYAAEAYTLWRSARDRRQYQYKVISADQKEIITRNSFPWTFPWGYPFRRTFAATRLAYADLENDTYPRPVGTHPLGSELYRDFSIYGGKDRQGRLIRLTDLIGNVREWTSTEAEKKSNFMAGGSPRTPAGYFYLPANRSYYSKDLVDEYHGGFRMVLEFDPIISF